MLTLRGNGKKDEVPLSGAFNAWHSEVTGFLISTDRSASVHLYDANEENGCLIVIPDSHKDGVFPVVNTKSYSKGYYLDSKQYPLDSGAACLAMIF
ncbi:phytanoyl-CoA dioxygenase family protein [Paenibacillus sp. FSL H8-0034]|uniref:phytanoyl-CoA dioxygenase family protein n=1 Tax=Paenibacillus sp. FSL H8-0034 TaxID=2954671 RepID=UPI0030FB0A15